MTATAHLQLWELPLVPVGRKMELSFVICSMYSYHCLSLPTSSTRRSINIRALLNLTNLQALTKPKLPDVWFANIFPHSVGVFLKVSFSMWKLFNLNQLFKSSVSFLKKFFKNISAIIYLKLYFQLWRFCLIVSAFGVISKNISKTNVKELFMLSSRSFAVCLTFKSFIYFELFYMM